MNALFAASNGQVGALAKTTAQSAANQYTPETKVKTSFNNNKK
jgi:hypothetical protein